ncbi:hypothetical protein CEXT_600191 [Caerostris extrusa]|uniref:Uncharacterized protein n=1 Tax=Caerostris extrusa TaxID=172846 RepID=A0AAV4Q5E9_CAEEX|nr:hypothetical protein CEXT_600191 [Caerostris extrusa]
MGDPASPGRRRNRGWSLACLEAGVGKQSWCQFRTSMHDNDPSTQSPKHALISHAYLPLIDGGDAPDAELGIAHLSLHDEDFLQPDLFGRHPGNEYFCQVPFCCS